MAKITFRNLKLNDEVTLTLPAKGERKETVIHGKVTDITGIGNKRVTIDGNRNSVVLTPRTNFVIETADPSAADIIDALPIGALFDYLNKFGKTKRWVKSGEDRYTKVETGKPAVSFSKAGFPAEGSKVTVL